MSAEHNHPYRNLPAERFWKRSVADRHFADLENLWTPLPLTPDDRVATAGSCFAQHIGANLARRGARFMDLEPAPETLRAAEEERRWGYGVFSCRYGNIYTARQLLQLFEEAFGQRTLVGPVWERNGRFFDALRPAVDPVGQADAKTVLALRQLHLAAVREMFLTLDVLVMTMGLTEAWVSREDGTVFPTAPGTIAGEYDPALHGFVNFGYPEVHADMLAFWRRLHEVNPSARMLLTVSPVPLQATATDDHVLVATTYSKSVLRAVAGDLAAREEGIHYFPSYELITAPAGRGMFFDPDMRNVNQFGVDYVMSHFFSGALGKAFSGAPAYEPAGLDVVCDEEAMFRSVAE